MTKLDTVEGNNLPNGRVSTNRQSAVYSRATNRSEPSVRLAVASGNTITKSRFPHIKDLQEKAREAYSQYGRQTPV